MKAILWTITGIIILGIILALMIIWDFNVNTVDAKYHAIIKEAITLSDDSYACNNIDYASTLDYKDIKRFTVVSCDNSTHLYSIDRTDPENIVVKPITPESLGFTNDDAAEDNHPLR